MNNKSGSKLIPFFSGIVYKTFLTKVLRMDEKEVDTAVQDMMKKVYSNLKVQRKKYSQGRPNNDSLPKEIMALPPFPYKIAKALNINYYRNVVMDAWMTNNPEAVTQPANPKPKPERKLSSFKRLTRHASQSESSTSSGSLDVPFNQQSFR